jgi:hypothetical protein
MRNNVHRAFVIALALSTTSAFAAKKTASSDVLGMGVGANAANAVTVRIDGKPTLLRLANVPAGDERAQAFLQCAVHDRVLRVERTKGGEARLLFLDGTDLNVQLAEFAQSQTQADACSLGKAIYTPRVIHANVSQPATPAAPQQTAATAPTAAPQRPSQGSTTVDNMGVHHQGKAISRTDATVQPNEEQLSPAAAVRKPAKP